MVKPILGDPHSVARSEAELAAWEDTAQFIAQRRALFINEAIREGNGGWDAHPYPDTVFALPLHVRSRLSGNFKIRE